MSDHRTFRFGLAIVCIFSHPLLHFGIEFLTTIKVRRFRLLVGALVYREVQLGRHLVWDQGSQVVNPVFPVIILWA